MQSRLHFGFSLLIILAGIFLTFPSAAAGSTSSTNVAPGGKRTFVVLESSSVNKSHHVFLDSLTAKGFKLTFGYAGQNLKISEYEEYLYDNLIIFAPNANEFGGELNTLEILKFMKSGGNVLVAGSQTTGAAVKDLAFEVGIEFPESGSVIDHFNVGQGDDGTHTLVKSSGLLKSKVIFHDSVTKPVLFRGMAHKLTSDNPLVFTLLGGSATSFSGQPTERASATQILGKSIGLVSTLQARNNARITISGSLELFSNKLFEDATADNKAFATSIALWTFHQRGVLREVSRTHHKFGESHVPDHYIVTDKIEYSIHVEEWNGASWAPFKANDVQIDFRMLDPYIRTTLDSDDKGTFSKVITLPDVYGVYTFSVEYHRIGYTFLHANDIVPIRPLLHNQYERFIGAAYPYYFSAASMMVGFFIFSFIFLHTKEPAAAVAEDKKKK